MSIGSLATTGDYARFFSFECNLAGKGVRGSMFFANASAEGVNGTVPGALKTALETPSLRMGCWFKPSASSLTNFFAIIAVGDGTVADTQMCAYTTNAGRVAFQTQVAGVVQGAVLQSDVLTANHWYHLEYQVWESPAGTHNYHATVTHEDGTSVNWSASSTDATTPLVPTLSHMAVGTFAELGFANYFDGYITEPYVDDNHDSGAFNLHDALVNSGNGRVFMDDAATPADWYWNWDRNNNDTVSGAHDELDDVQNGTFSLSTVKGTPLWRHQLPAIAGSVMNKDEFGIGLWIKPATNYDLGFGGTTDTRAGWEMTRQNFTDTTRLISDSGAETQWDAVYGADTHSYEWNSPAGQNIVTCPAGAWSSILVWYKLNDPRAAQGFVFTVYVNGELLTSGTKSATTPPAIGDILDIASLYLGNVGGGLTYAGSVAELCVLTDTQFTADEALQHFAGIAPNLIWPTSVLKYYNPLRHTNDLASPVIGSTNFSPVLVGSAAMDASDHPEIIRSLGGNAPPWAASTKNRRLTGSLRERFRL